jgi:hypothetical protein
MVLFLCAAGNCLFNYLINYSKTEVISKGLLGDCLINFNFFEILNALYKSFQFPLDVVEGKSPSWLV